MVDKQIGGKSTSSMLQISADTGSGNGILNEMFPDEFFENDARLNGSSTFLVNSVVSEPTIYNSSQQSQVCIHIPPTIIVYLLLPSMGL